VERDLLPRQGGFPPFGCGRRRCTAHRPGLIGVRSRPASSPEHLARLRSAGSLAVLRHSWVLSSLPVAPTRSRRSCRGRIRPRFDSVLPCALISRARPGRALRVRSDDCRRRGLYLPPRRPDRALSYPLDELLFHHQPRGASSSVRGCNGGRAVSSAADRVWPGSSPPCLPPSRRPDRGRRRGFLWRAFGTRGRLRPIRPAAGSDVILERSRGTLCLFQYKCRRSPSRPIVPPLWERGG
jgi:hypothetical protein